MTNPKRTWSLRRYLVAGVLVWLPILATLWVIRFIVSLMDSLLLWLPEQARPQALIGYAVPGLGILIALVLLFVTGLLVTNLIGKRLVQYWDGVIRRIPLVRSIHGGVKSFAESVFSQSNSFRRVVAIQYPRAGVWSIGFITAEGIAEVGAKTGAAHSCVYIPTAPNPTSGFIVMVPTSELLELHMSVDSAMKMIITCGVVMPAPPPKPAPALDRPAA
ncbi:MAG: DUF502 domain-containing protein [Gammaproteobacteria bacterium]